MTVGELKELLDDFGDNLTVVIEVNGEARYDDIDLTSGRDGDGTAACVVHVA